MDDCFAAAATAAGCIDRTRNSPLLFLRFRIGPSRLKQSQSFDRPKKETNSGIDQIRLSEMRQMCGSMI